MVALAYPDPPLAEDQVHLRPWRTADAEALAAAWNDPAIQAGCAVPKQRSAADAEAWISGHRQRIDAGAALDLVITDATGVVVQGEVGLGPFDFDRGAAMLGFWVAPESRRSGLAAAAVRLVADWAVTQEIGSLVAQTTDANLGSIGVLRSCGFVLGDSRSVQTWTLRR